MIDMESIALKDATVAQVHAITLMACALVRPASPATIVNGVSSSIWLVKTGHYYFFIACNAGNWGVECAQECRCGNGEPCDHVTGECVCASGWRGERCDTRKFIPQEKFPWLLN